jgi:hypothetical protein
VELAEEGSGTQVVLRQTELEPAGIGEIAPGWDWYLDRLLAVVGGTALPDLDAFERDYLPLGAEYVARRDGLSA